jgi:hypothetical protein
MRYALYFKFNMETAGETHKQGAVIDADRKKIQMIILKM